MGNAREQEEELFDAARKLTAPAQRKAFLDAACTDDGELRRRLAGLYKLSWPNLRCERVKWAWNRCEVCMT